jgi:iron-sulfur cluster repair protein YtfE (RIC family)
MSNNKTFMEIKEKNFDTLEMYVPVVAKVHGGTHPEFLEVRKVYDALIKKIKEAGDGEADLHEEFSQLRQITQNYRIPEDTCESYEAVYNMLAEMDEAYGE